MKILVVSDTHGHTKNLERVLEKVGDIDLFIHCGDLEGGEDYIRALRRQPGNRAPLLRRGLKKRRREMSMW